MNNQMVVGLSRSMIIDHYYIQRPLYLCPEIKEDEHEQQLIRSQIHNFVFSLVYLFHMNMKYEHLHRKVIYFTMNQFQEWSKYKILS